jgi:hypothetical protein
MSNLGTGTPYVISKQAIVGTTPIVGIETQVGNNRIVSYVLITDSTVDGAWKIEVSNDFARDKDVSMGNNVNLGNWVDITSAFVPAIVAVAHGTVATQKQYAQLNPIGSRVVRVTFTPSAGAGNVSAAISGGSY